jgi:DNA-binding response OmpR family regulator
MPDLSHTVVVIEEDHATRMFLADNLTADGFDVHPTGDPGHALALCARIGPDAAIVDVNGGSGRTFARAIRSGERRDIDDRLPLMLLSNRHGELDVLRSFEAGADDHLAKPFSYPELRARLHALLRRATMAATTRPARQVRALRINDAERRVTVGDRRVEMSAKEFALLSVLASDPTRVFTKQHLLRELWGIRSLGTTRTLDSHACRLRHKLSVNGERFVINVWGVGYKLIDGPPAAAAAPDPVAPSALTHTA